MRPLPSILLVASLAVCASAPTAARAQKWCFVVAGDGRADPSHHRPEDKDGINTLITGEIRDAVIKEHAKFLMWSGDLVYGYAKDEATFEKELLAWRNLMGPLYSRHIPILACRGNHDAGGSGHKPGVPDAWAAWNKVFTGKYAMPQNGPEGEKGMTFYYTRGPVLAIGLDQYIQSGEAINQGWLDGVLAKNRKPFVFAMGHEPAFMDGAHKDTMDASPEKRDAMWNSLVNAGERAFFCGHDHLYDHMEITRSTGDPGPVMHQFVAGTSGAPFYDAGEYSGDNPGWKLTRVKNIVHTYGYILVEIDGGEATITFKGRTSPGHYEAMDQFVYRTPTKTRK